MATRWAALCAALLAVAAQVASAQSPAGAAACKAMFGAGASLLLFADPGDFSGSAESKYLFENLLAKKNHTFFDYACAHTYSGRLLRQRVVLITTGIGPTTAGLCTAAVLEYCGKLVKEAIYMGTSGWSAAVGGIVTPAGPDTPAASCAAPGPSVAKGLTTRVGDLCVTPYSSNWMCKQASWTQQCSGFPNLCTRPQENFGPSASFLYGQCFFTSAPASSMALANELLSFAKTAAWAPPQPSDSVFDENTEYWNATSKGTGISYPSYARSDKPAVFPPTVCQETDGQFFYSGIPWDITARDYVAQGINLAFGYSGNASKTGLDVIAVSAMEAIGFGEAFERYHRKPDVKKIPYTTVRGNSNWLHHPAKLDDAATGVWSYEKIMPNNFFAGYSYAIASYSSLVLGVFKKRCLAIEPPVTRGCDYKLGYTGP